MKQLLTITAILFSVTLFSQESKLIFKSNGGKIFDDAKSLYQFSDGYGEIAKIKSSGQDTLEITYPALIKNKHLFKYIKVGDKIFQEVYTNESTSGNFGFNGRFSGAKPLILTNNGYAIAEPARLIWNENIKADTVSLRQPFIRYSDTTALITNKRICGHVIDSLILNSDTIPFKPSKNKTSDRKKIFYESYDILGFIVASDTASMPMGSFLTVDGKNKYYSYINKIILQDRAKYQIELMKRYKLSAEKAAKEAERRFSLIK